MKKIEAIIRVSKFEAVQEALHDAHVYFYTYVDVKGVGREKEENVYRGNIYDAGSIPRRKLEIVLSEEFVQPVVDAIIKTASTGKIGDGKIFITSIDKAYRIRNGEEIQEGLV